MTYNDFRKIEKYNIHNLLYDLTRGHFKSKWLCKHNKHNYIMRTEVVRKKPITEIEYAPDGLTILNTITKYPKELKTYMICNCCKKRIDLK